MGEILYLTLKKEWFNLINSNVKTEEYREIKPYWMNRFMCCYDKHFCKCKSSDCVNCHSSIIPVKYKYVHFRHGYAKDAPTMQFELENISFGKGKPEWGR